MGFLITNVETFKHPADQNAVDDLLSQYKTTVSEISDALRARPFEGESVNQGFQKRLASQLETFFAAFFEPKGFSVQSTGYGIRYSHRIDLRADSVVRDQTRDKALFIEIEFRPTNHQNDILKFEIGHKNNLTELAILLVALDRDSINHGYTTMPEFKDCKKLIVEFEPRCPILLLGIDGQDT